MIPTSTLLNRWRSILLVLAASLLVGSIARIPFESHHA
jgi:hypothetical protein